MRSFLVTVGLAFLLTSAWEIPGFTSGDEPAILLFVAFIALGSSSFIAGARPFETFRPQFEDQFLYLPKNERGRKYWRASVLIGIPSIFVFFMLRIIWTNLPTPYNVNPYIDLILFGLSVFGIIVGVLFFTRSKRYWNMEHTRRIPV